MTYIFLGLILLWLLLGTERASSLIHATSPLPERRKLALRVLGFLAMGSWVHLLPSVLLVIYMREEGILSTEILGDDLARPVIASLYLLAPTLAIAGASCAGAALSKYLKKQMRLFSWLTAASMASFALSVVVCYYVLDRDLISALFLGFVAAPIALYFHLSILTDPDKQHQLYWAPFALICIVTAALFAFSGETYQVISRQLRLFGSGGCADVKVHFRGMNFAGKLILFTEHSTYILVVADQEYQYTCTIRIPANEALIAHANDSSYFEFRPRQAVSDDMSTYRKLSTSLPEEYTKNAKNICGPIFTEIIQDDKGEWGERNQIDALDERRSCSTRSVLSAAFTRWFFKNPSELPSHRIK